MVVFVVMMLDLGDDAFRDGFWRHFPLAALVGAVVLFWRAPAGAYMGRAFRFTIFGLLLGLILADLAGRFAGVVLPSNEVREILLVFTFMAMAVAGLSRRPE